MGCTSGSFINLKLAPKVSKIVSKIESGCWNRIELSSAKVVEY
jgi:hypothetical protein